MMQPNDEMFKLLAVITHSCEILDLWNNEKMEGDLGIVSQTVIVSNHTLIFMIYLIFRHDT